MNYVAANVVIVGLGLIGGSLARALRKSGFSQRFIGFGHRLPSLEQGVAMGVIDEYTLDIDEAIELADILVIATPTLVASTLLEEILPRLAGRDDAPIVTDVASVKGNLLRTAESVCGAMPANLVLAHPIAGSERSGVGSSDENLFVNHRVILTPEKNNDAAAVELVRQMWQSTGADVVDMSVDHHDAVLAATSHLPHVLAYALVDALAQSEQTQEIFRFAAGGFRDFTRIASSDPLMWKDIALANRDALLDAIDLFSDKLGQLREDVAQGHSEQLLETFTRAKAARDEFADMLANRSESSS
ncbi:MAG: prephenate dehydrogenase/arogenate dehydrogenase family protein [Halioglobus sp.]